MVAGYSLLSSPTAWASRCSTHPTVKHCMALQRTHPIWKNIAFTAGNATRNRLDSEASHTSNGHLNDTVAKPPGQPSCENPQGRSVNHCLGPRAQVPLVAESRKVSRERR